MHGWINLTEHSRILLLNSLDLIISNLLTDWGAAHYCTASLLPTSFLARQSENVNMTEALKS